MIIQIYHERYPDLNVATMNYKVNFLDLCHDDLEIKAQLGFSDITYTIGTNAIVIDIYDHMKKNDIIKPNYCDFDSFVSIQDSSGNSASPASVTFNSTSKKLTVYNDGKNKNNLDIGEYKAEITIKKPIRRSQN
jgi:hypothetical protein